MTAQETLRSRPLLVSNDFADMLTGNVRLHVPLLNGIVQLGTPDHNNMGELSITKTLRSVLISNSDGSPLQAESVFERIPTQDDPAKYMRIPVLKEPVSQLIFQKTKNADGAVRWYADGEGVHIHNIPAMSRFVTAVGLFAEPRMRQQRASEMLARRG